MVITQKPIELWSVQSYLIIYNKHIIIAWKGFKKNRAITKVNVVSFSEYLSSEQPTTEIEIPSILTNRTFIMF